MTMVLFLIITITSLCNHTQAGKLIITPNSAREDGLIRIELVEGKAVDVPRLIDSEESIMFSASYSGISRHFKKGVEPLKAQSEVAGVVKELKASPTEFSYLVSDCGSLFDGDYYTTYDVYESGDSKLMASFLKSDKKR